MKKPFQAIDKYLSPVTIFFAIMAVYFTLMCVWAKWGFAQETPYPDAPFTPYKHIYEVHHEVQLWNVENAVKMCVEKEYMDGTKSEPECEDLGFSDEAQPDQCQIKVAITEPVDIKSVCWEDTTKILNPQGLMRYMLIRPGCVALVMSQFRHNIEVYQDKDCWILLYDGTGKNQRWKMEKEEVIKNLQGA